MNDRYFDRQNLRKIEIPIFVLFSKKFRICLISAKIEILVCGSSNPRNGEQMSEKSELITHLKEELDHVHGDIEHVQRDLEALISHIKNLDEHLHHLVDETTQSSINPEPF